MKVHQIIAESLSIDGAGLDNKANEYYTSAVEYLREILNISPNVNIAVHLNYDYGSGDSTNATTLPDPDNKSKIHLFIKGGLSRAEVVRVMAHEMVHVQQLASGRLRIDIENGVVNAIYWEGELTKETKYNRSGEWENEAHAKQQELLHAVIGKIGNLT